MGASRYLVGLVCVGLAAGCVDGSKSEIDVDDLNLAYEVESGPSLPAAPEGASCVLIQRGTLGAVEDTDIGFGNGATYAMGAYPYTWTGPSPYNHWSAYQFDLSPVPADATVVLGVFSNYALWSDNHSTVRAHRIDQSWSEATATWSSFTGNGAITGWDPEVLGTFDPEGVGFHSIDVTGLVQDWHTGSVANNGLILEEDPVVLHSYVASEASSVSSRPSLYVCWIEGSEPGGDPEPECGNAGVACESDAGCCDGMTCLEGVCTSVGSLPPAQVCAADGGACGGQTPCCNPSAICDGICIPLQPSDPGGGGGSACFPMGAECGDDGLCCSGSCLDGVCTALPIAGVCLELDAVDADGNAAACSPDSPCCDGSHCILGLCQPDEFLYGNTCSLPGQACDIDNSQWCCWSQACVDGTCQ